MKKEMIQDSNTSGELLICVECMAEHSFKKNMGCNIGAKECSTCDCLLWLGTGAVSPLPEPVE